MTPRNPDDSDDTQNMQVFDLQDTTSDYFEKSVELSHSDDRDDSDQAVDGD